MSTADIQSRLRTLFDANKGIVALTTKLAKLAPDASSPDSRADLGAEIHQALKDLEEDSESLRQDASDLLTPPPARRRDAAKEQERVSVATQLERLGEDVRSSRALFRKAQLHSKRAQDAARRAERAALFAGAAGSDSPEHAPTQRRKAADPQQSRDDVLAGAAGDVTLALRRTHALMQSELQRSHFAHETLQRSTAALNDLGQGYASLDDLLGRSRALIRTLRTSHKSDTWYLETAVAVLLATLAWLVFRRLAYFPLYYLAYAPARAALRLVFAVVNATLGIFVGGAGAKSLSLSATSGATSLKLKPSASGKGHTRVKGMSAPSMNVGGGGKDQRSDGSLSEEVGQMAEERKEGQQEEQQQQGGTVLRERRADEPVNPKKRMMEEPPPPPPKKDEGRKDEL